MSNTNAIPNFANQNLFKVMQSETFTIPDSVSAPSPAGISSGLSPATIFDGRRPTVGGYIYAAFSDAAGPAGQDFQWKVNPKDVVLMSAAGATTTVSVNGVVVFTWASTTTAGVLGYYS